MTTNSRVWFLGLGTVAMLAALAGGCLLWLLVTEPVALAQSLAGGL